MRSARASNLQIRLVAKQDLFAQQEPGSATLPPPVGAHSLLQGEKVPQKVFRYSRPLVFDNDSDHLPIQGHRQPDRSSGGLHGARGVHEEVGEHRGDLNRIEQERRHCRSPVSDLHPNRWKKARHPPLPCVRDVLLDVGLHHDGVQCLGANEISQVCDVVANHQ